MSGDRPMYAGQVTVGRGRPGSTGCRCVAVWRRFSTRHGRWRREPVCSGFSVGSARSSGRINCAGCSGSAVSRPCRTALAQATGSGQRRRRITHVRSSRRPWRMGPRARRPIGPRTYSIADAIAPSRLGRTTHVRLTCPQERYHILC